jgi:hypothetical protein
MSLILPHTRGLYVPNVALYGAGGCSCTPVDLTGDRTASITVTSDIVWDAGTNSNLVDGATGQNSTDSVDVPALFADANYIDFQFASNTLINEVTWRAGGTFDFGNWKMTLGGETSNTFAVAGTASTVIAITGLTLGGTNARLVKVGLFAGSNTWLQEIEFQQCTC